MSALSGQGAMALVELDTVAASDLIARYPDVTLAVHASSRQTVIAGPPDQVDAVIARIAAQDRLARRIDVDVASHHPIIDPVLPQLRIELADLSPRPPSIPVFTTTLTAGEPTFDAEYWAANLRNPVQFSQAVAAAGGEHGIFVEVSPHPVLTYAIDETLAQLHHHSIGTLHRDSHDTLNFHTNLNATHTVRPPENPQGTVSRVELPTTPWHHTRHWIADRESGSSSGLTPRAGTVLGEHISVATMPPVHLWRAKLTPEARPYPGSHRIHGLEVVPVSVLVQTLSAAAAECGASGLRDIRFVYPIAVDRPRVVQVLVEGDSVTLSSSPASDAPAHRWVRHVSARFSAQSDPNPAAATEDRREPEAVDSEMCSAAKRFETLGVQG